MRALRLIAALSFIVLSFALHAGGQEAGPEGTASPDTTAAEAQSPPESGGLSHAQKRLIEACENYVALFPNGEETPKVLIIEGDVYFEAKDYLKAASIYEKVLENFPESGEPYTIASKRVISCYSELGRYDLVEKWGEKLKGDPNLPGDVREMGHDVVIGALIKEAELLAESGGHVGAAKKYEEFALREPDHKDAPLALFKAAEEYQKGGLLEEAADTFRKVAITYPTFGKADGALNNAAQLYTELENWNQAALVYEQLVKSYPNSEFREAALNNLNIIYTQKLHDWQRAAWVNETYVKDYSSSETAADFQFETADIYKKLNNPTKAIRVYKEFAAQHPLDPRTVNAYYELGKYYMGKGDVELALDYFGRATATNDTLKLSGLESNDYYAMLSFYEIAEAKFHSYQAVRFDDPERLSEDLRRKKKLLEEVIRYYGKVKDFGDPEKTFEALHKIGMAWENLADTYFEQKLPPDLSEFELSKRMVSIAESSVEYVRQAEKFYRGNVTLYETKAVSIEDTSGVRWVEMSRRRAEELARKGVKLLVAGKRRYADAWVDYVFSNSWPKIVAKVERKAKGFFDDFPDQYISLKRKLIDETICPEIYDVLIPKYEDALSQARSVGMGEDWIKGLGEDMAYLYAAKWRLYRDLSDEVIEKFISSEKRAESFFERLSKSPTGLDYLGLYDNLALLMDHLALPEDASYSAEEALQYVDGLGIELSYPDTLKGEVIKFIYDIAARNDSLAAYCMSKAEKYRKLMESPPEGKHYPEDFENMSYYYSDDFSATFSDEAKGLYIRELELAESFGIPQTAPYVSASLNRLAVLDPEEYAKRAKVEKKTLVFVTDSTWVCSPSGGDGWIKPDFDDSGWSHALAGTMPDTVLIAGLEGADDIWDSGSDTLFFRKAFEIPSDAIIKGADIAITADDNYVFYLNGNDLPIAEDSADTLDWFRSDTYDIREYLSPGRNIIAIMAWNADTVGYGLMAKMRVDLIVPVREEVAEAPPEEEAPSPSPAPIFSAQDSLYMETLTPEELERFIGCRRRQREAEDELSKVEAAIDSVGQELLKVEEMIRAVEEEISSLSSESEKPSPPEGERPPGGDSE